MTKGVIHLRETEIGLVAILGSDWSAINRNRCPKSAETGFCFTQMDHALRKLENTILRRVA